MAIRPIRPSDVDDAVEVIATYVDADRRRPVIERAADTNENDASGLVLDVDGVVGCFIWTAHTDTDIDDILSRPVPHTVEGPYTVLRYAYIEPDYTGSGHGTRMLESMLAETRWQVYAEAWLRPGVADLEPLVERFGFETVFHDEEYWNHPSRDPGEECSYCEVPHEDCACRGAVYRLVR